MPYCCAAKSMTKLTGATHFAVLYDMPMLTVVEEKVANLRCVQRLSQPATFTGVVIYQSPASSCIEGTIAALVVVTSFSRSRGGIYPDRQISDVAGINKQDRAFFLVLAAIHACDFF